MSGYTPTISELREAWLSAEFEERDSTTSDDDLRAEFDRALVAHDAEVRASELEEYATAIDREHAEDTARIRVTNVRCDMCGLRYEERDEYSCDESRHPHEYDEGELAAARVVILEPTWDGDQARERASAIRAGGVAVKQEGETHG